MSQQYFYFVSGLPNLTLEDNKLALTPEQFREEARMQLSAADFRLLELLHLPVELEHLLHLLYKDNKPAPAEVLYPAEYWEGFIAYQRQVVDSPDTPCPKDYHNLPSWLGETISTVLRQEEMQDAEITQHQLLTRFYDWAGKHPNSFIKQWFTHEAQIRNILLAISGRKLELPYAKYLIGSDDTNDKLAKSHAADFGLGKENELFEQLIRIYEQNNILYRERSYDIMRWKWVDGINFFNYFTIDRILGYYCKLRIETRWLTADTEAGKKVFNEVLNTLENSFSFPDDYNIKAVKKR